MACLKIPENTNAAANKTNQPGTKTEPSNASVVEEQTRSYTVDELPFAEALKGFILFKISDGVHNNVMKQSLVMNGRKETIVDNG